MISVILYRDSPFSSINSAWMEPIALTFLKSSGAKYRYLKPCIDIADKKNSIQNQIYCLYNVKSKALMKFYWI